MFCFFVVWYLSKGGIMSMPCTEERNSFHSYIYLTLIIIILYLKKIALFQFIRNKVEIFILSQKNIRTILKLTT